MGLRNWFALFLGKAAKVIIDLLCLGAGGTWPGEIALTISPHILASLTHQLHKGVIVVAGTNGKTTTSLMIKKILEKSEQTVIHNDSGANLLNGIVGAFIKHADWSGRVEKDYAVLEVDENTLPLLAENLKSKISRPKADRSLDENLKITIVLLNLFRDQLDRYGEVDIIAEKWEKALQDFSRQPAYAGKSSDVRQDGKMTLILNSDDPQVAHLGIILSSRAKREIPSDQTRPKGISRSLHSLEMTTKVIYFGVNEPKYFLKNKEHAVDSIFCLSCGGRLKYDGIYYSHLGIWKCETCGEKRPTPEITTWHSPLPGLYNLYNTLAAVSTMKALGIDDDAINSGLLDFSPAFGRQEEFIVNEKKIKIFLSKNPAGFNQSLRTVIELINSHPRLDRGSTKIDSRVRGNDGILLLVLNDRIPDGRDVSWIWDVDFETIPDATKVIVSGDRVYDMAVRMKYAEKSQIPNPKSQINSKIQFPKCILESGLEKSIYLGLNNMKSGETLYILPTYSAMLEVRKILSGKKIL